jgi:hypothetical protein
MCKVLGSIPSTGKKEQKEQRLKWVIIKTDELPP